MELIQCRLNNSYSVTASNSIACIYDTSVMLASPSVLVRTSTSDCVVQVSDIIACTVLFSAMVWDDVLLEQPAMSVGIAAPLALDL